MRKNEFYEVDGMDKFVPVELISICDTSCHIQINTPSGTRDLVVDKVYSFPKTPKVAVPEFVAKHIEYLRSLNSPMRDVFGWINDKQLQNWLCRVPDADETLARAWLDGYEVERERCFIVEIPDPEKPNGKKTNLAKFKGKVFLSSTMPPTPLTEAEIKRNHAWAWPFAREVLE